MSLFFRQRLPRGFTLLEVLIALLIFSMGLLGLAGILVLSVKTNHAATQRTQAIFLAQSLAERMRANTNGVWAAAYDGATPPTPAVSCDPTTTPCTATGLASWDRSLWWDQVTQSLPAPSAVVRCVQTLVTLPQNFLSRPPFEGYCEIQISWSEAVQNGTRNNTGSANTTGQQTFSWVFTP